MSRKLHVSAIVALVLSFGGPPMARAQDGPSLDVTGMLRTGFRVESSATGGRDGFALYDARLGATGKVGIVFDYVAGIEVDRREESIRLLDAALGFPIKDDLLLLGIGLERSRFGDEAIDELRRQGVGEQPADVALRALLGELPVGGDNEQGCRHRG